MHVEDEVFRSEFIKVFQEKHLLYRYEWDNSFLNITDKNNLLYKLIEFDKKTKKNTLARDLIQLISDKGHVDDTELMNNAFYYPTKENSIYMILFEDYFGTLSIRMRIIKKLISKLINWSYNGFNNNEISRWSILCYAQREVANKIWDFIGKHTDQDICFGILIYDANKQFEAILAVQENTKSCILSYCQDAYDTHLYFDLFQNLEENLLERRLEDLKLPEELDKLRPFVDRLNPISKLSAWRKFLKQKKSKIKSKFIPL